MLYIYSIPQRDIIVSTESYGQGSKILKLAPYMIRPSIWVLPDPEFLIEHLHKLLPKNEAVLFHRRNSNLHLSMSRMAPAKGRYVREADQPLCSFEGRRAATHRLKCPHTKRLKSVERLNSL